MKLSKTELRVLKCVLEGKSNKEIMRKLFISANTIKTHMRHIYQKFGFEGSTQSKRSRLIAAGKLTGMLAAPEFDEIRQEENGTKDDLYRRKSLAERVAMCHDTDINLDGEQNENL